jgi:hypothetical protein
VNGRDWGSSVVFGSTPTENRRETGNWKMS